MTAIKNRIARENPFIIIGVALVAALLLLLAGDKIVHGPTGKSLTGDIVALFAVVIVYQCLKLYSLSRRFSK